MDSTIESTEPQPRDVQVGQWVKPFEGYDDIPPFIGKDINRYVSKGVVFNSPEIGPWHITMAWDQEEMESIHQNPRAQEQVLVIMPNGARVCRHYEILNVQKELETRLMRIFATADKYGDDPGELDQPTNHRAVIKLASGEELKTGDLWLTDDPENNFQGFKFNGVIFEQVYIPDTANVAETIEAKLEKIERQVK